VPFRIVLRKESKVVTGIILKGGAPRDFGAHIRRCFAAQLFQAVAHKGGGK